MNKENIINRSGTEESQSNEEPKMFPIFRKKMKLEEPTTANDFPGSFVHEGIKWIINNRSATAGYYKCSKSRHKDVKCPSRLVLTFNDGKHVLNQSAEHTCKLSNDVEISQILDIRQEMHDYIEAVAISLKEFHILKKILILKVIKRKWKPFGNTLFLIG
jgi:hypothetical protein